MAPRAADALDPMDHPRRALERLGPLLTDQEAILDAQPAPPGTEHEVASTNWSDSGPVAISASPPARLASR